MDKPSTDNSSTLHTDHMDNTEDKKVVDKGRDTGTVALAAYMDHTVENTAVDHTVVDNIAVVRYMGLDCTGYMEDKGMDNTQEPVPAYMVA